MLKSKNIIAGALAISLSVCGAVALTGCDAIKGAVGQTEIGQKVLGSKTTDKSDRIDCYKTLQDINGQLFTTVIYMEPMDGTDFDAELCKQVLTQSNINWYQLISSDTRSAPGLTEHGLLYMPASVSLSDMAEVSNLLSSTFNAHVMTAEEYDQYLADAPSGSIVDGSFNVYEQETTEYGPASQTQEAESGEGQ